MATTRKTATRTQSTTRKQAGTSRKKMTARKKPAARKRAYSLAASAAVHEELHEYEAGRARSGRSGRKVTSRKQAIAIGLSEARAAGKKVPPKPKRRS